MKRKLFAVIGLLAMVLGLPLGYNFAAAPNPLLVNCTPADGIVIQPPYSDGYVACSLGILQGLPAGIGGMTFKYDDPNTLLFATHTEGTVGQIYAVSVVRDGDNHIVDVVNPGTSFASAPYVSTGMAYGPENVLFYSRSPVNELGEIKPGSSTTDKVIGLTALGVTPSVSGINFVPEGFPNEGELKLVTNRTGEWYAATISPDGEGTYSIGTITKKSQILYYPEGFVYVPPASSPFPDYSAMLVPEYYRATVSAYLLDAESNPIPDTRSPFLTGLVYPQSTAIDPLTGDLLVVNRGARLISVRGFGTQPWVPPTPTPTATTPPPGTYMARGLVSDGTGRPLSGIDIYLDGVPAAVTFGGDYIIDGLIAGTYTISAASDQYTFIPRQYTITVPPDATNLNFNVPRVSRPPVILVHGYLGLGNITDKCEYGVKRADEETIPALWDMMPEWLEQDGFEVYIAHWDSAPYPDITTPLENSAECLAGQIAEVKQRTGQSQVILIAHSMGGPVSRAYLQSSTYAARQDVKTLITLGSPHGGINGLGLVATNPLIGLTLGIFCIQQPAFCQMDPSYMGLFNSRSERNSVDYTFIGGDGGGGPLGGALWLINGPNDGLVSTASANGKYYSWFGSPTAVKHTLTPYQTDEDHIGDWGNWYFESRPPQYRSDSYKCVREVLLGLDRVDCQAPPSRIQEQGSPFAFAPVQTGHISAGETISRTLTVDTAGQSIFALNWVTQTLELTLVNPDGLMIDPNYALANPSIVTFDSGPAANGSPGWMTYTFTDTVPGGWTLKVSAHDAGQNGTDWTVLTGFASDRTMDVGTGTKLYQIGDTATLTATLNNGTSGIAGATVNVDLARPDGATDTLALTDMGGGSYQGTYTIPNAPGYVEAIFTANGDDGGTTFSRQSSQLLSIMPQTGQLTGSYADRAVNEDGRGSDDAIEVDVCIDISTAGDYNLTADLYAGDQLVAQSSKVFSATAGVQTVTLRFDGSDLYNAGLDGPYLLTNLVLVDLQLAVPTIMQSDLYTTAAYEYAQFMPDSVLYLPMINR